MSKEKSQAEEKVKVVVLKPFRDKFDRTVRYAEGVELEVDVERAEDLVSRELVEYVEPIA